MADLTGTPVYTDHVRQLETTDPKHPATWNPNYQTLINNDAFVKARSDIEGFLSGGFLPNAGGTSFTYDGNNRVSQIAFTTNPVGTVTIFYDDVNGGRVNYVEAVLTSPLALTIRETFSYDGNGNITGSTRTVI